MLRITRQNVNVRISNREDNNVSDQVACLLERLTQAMRCYLHPVCSVLGQTQRAQLPASLLLLANWVGSKRLALEPAAIPVGMSVWHSIATRPGIHGRLTGITQLAG